MARVAVLTISDGVAVGHRRDTSGDTIVDIVDSSGWLIVRRNNVADEQDEFSGILREWADSGEVDLILTTGGTGLGPRDVTPEATKRILHREVPGIPEAMRSISLSKTLMAMISRQAAGTRGKCLIINLPGNPIAVKECLDVILPVLSHALQVLNGPTEHHPRMLSEEEPL